MQLVATQGPLRGACWTLTDGELLLGRSKTCDIVVRDSTVSRRHCIIESRQGKVRLVSLVEYNPTLVNGRALGESDLYVGDAISVGSCVFILSGTEAAAEGRSSSGLESHTVSVNHWECMLRRVDAEDPGRTSFPQTARDMAELFALGQDLGAVSSLDELVGILEARLDARFKPQALWVARCHGADHSLSFHALSTGASGDGAAAPPAEAMARAARERCAMAWRDDGGATLTCVVPMTLREASVGVIALRMSVEPERADPACLDYLIAFAQEAAPFFLLLQRTDHMREDLERLRTLAGESVELVGASKALRRVSALVRRAAVSDYPVLILGETGTGKELVARLIHDLSGRARNPFVAVNCAAIPEGLMESDLFGHEKGAYTGAIRQRAGYFERAHTGTLFLDEVGDLSTASQARILRAIETGRFQRVGSEKDVAADLRIVAATNKDLHQAIEDGAFRQDLYYRLNTFEIHLPPLRERASDIPLLAEHFFRQARVRAKRPLAGVRPEALDYLQEQPWPGNVRELKNRVYRAVELARSEWIGVDDVRLLPPPGTTAAGLPGELVPLREVEERYLRHVLRQCDGNLRAATRVLGISRTTLYKKMTDYGIKGA